MRKKAFTTQQPVATATSELPENAMPIFRWPIELIEEVALQLFLRSEHEAELCSSSDLWDDYIHLAIECLDTRRDSCLHVIRKVVSRQKYQQESANLEPFPERAPFVDAIKEITGQSRTARAVADFEKYLASLIINYDSAWQYSGLPDITRPSTPETAQEGARLWLEQLRAAGMMRSVHIFEHQMEFTRFKEETIRSVRSEAGRKKKKDTRRKNDA